jgi:hypothetical protein
LPKKTILPPVPPDFDGWNLPRYTPIPDQLLDEWLPHLGEAELKVLLYIMRRTFGFKKNADAISLRQMAEGIVRRDGTRLDWGAGVSENSAIRAVRRLQERGLIEVEQQQSADGDFATNIYRLRLQRSRNGERTPLPGGGTHPPTVGEPVPPPWGIQESSQQETVGQEDSNPPTPAELAIAQTVGISVAQLRAIQRGAPLPGV